MNENGNHGTRPSEKPGMETQKPSESGASGGSRAGLFRTPISGGVQSATSAHGLPRPALAVRNLMEQVSLLCLGIYDKPYYMPLAL